MPSGIQAIGFDTYGGPDVLHAVTLPEPHAGAGEVRIRVAAAGVAPVDVMARTGQLARLYSGSTPPYVPGMEVAGVVDEVGPDVPADLAVAVGTEVVGFVDFVGSHGGYSDVVVLPAASVTHVPARADMPEAASFVMNSLTARNALDFLAMPVGATLLVTGAAGSVGGYLLQLGKHDGLRIIATAGRDDEELVRSLGADEFVARDDNVPERIRELAPDGVDAVADAAAIGDRVTGAVRDGGQYAPFRATNTDPVRGITMHRLNVRERGSDNAALASLRDLVDAGVLTMRVGEVLPASEAATAHRKLEAGGVRGRIILEFPVRR